MTTDTNTSSTVESFTDSIPGGSLSTFLVVGGAVLFVVPEPITSVVGVLLVLTGLLVWLGSHLLG